MEFFTARSSFLMKSKNLMTKKITSRCWNDIDFEKTEKMLLESSIQSKTAFYRYYKNQELAEGRTEDKIEEDLFFRKIKRRHYSLKSLKTVFFLIYHNGLKAIFKEYKDKKHKNLLKDNNIFGYNISRFLNLRIVPPTVIREINGQRGIVQLFVENVKDYPKEYLDHLSPVQKSNIYTYMYMSGNTDLSYSNLLISKKCLLPAVIDNDHIEPHVLIQYGKTPFRGFPINGKHSALDRRDYELAPFEKAMPLKSADFETLENTFSGLSFEYIKKFRKYFLRHDNISYFIYKDFYFISTPRKIYKHFLPIKKYSDYSPQTIERVKLLDEKTLKDLSTGYLKENKNFINGVLHRQELFLEEMKKLRNKESLNQ